MAAGTADSAAPSHRGRNQLQQQQQRSDSQADSQNPYPLYATISFLYLTQTAPPRSWCLRIVSNKYPAFIQHTPPCGGMAPLVS